MPKQQPRNPFYVLLVVVGIAFLITASAYGVMAFRAMRFGEARTASGGSGRQLMIFMQDHGLQLMAGEIGVLAVATCGAIGIDSRWNRRQQAEKQQAAETPVEPGGEPPTRSVS